MLALAFAAFLSAQVVELPAPPPPEGARVEVYKTAGGADLKLWIFGASGQSTGQRRPAIVFFFGGAWRTGDPRQFEPQARYFASRGMVAITADYRVSSRHGAKIVDCVRDAKSAIRHVRRHAARLGIDPDRIAAAGGSAGGHLAACTGVITGLDEPGEDASVSSRPNALALFDPVLVLAPVTGFAPRGALEELLARAGIEPEAISPYHHVRTGAPPAIIFHGTADTTVPYVTAAMFEKKMKSAGNRCELVAFEGAAHGFFNYGRGGNLAYEATMKKMVEFLVSLGWLKAR
jgi:acetyl esterase/lipase